MVPVTSSTGWTVDGEHYGNYLVVTRFGHEKRVGSITIHVHHYEPDLESATPIDLHDMETDKTSDWGVSWTVVLRCFTEELRSMVRWRKMRVRSRRRLGNNLKLQVCVLQSEASTVWQALNKHLISKHMGDICVPTGAVYRFESSLLDSLVEDLAAESPILICESPKWMIIPEDPTGARNLVMRRLKTHECVVGRRWQVQPRPDGTWTGTLRIDVIRSSAAHVKLVSTLVDPRLSALAVQRWLEKMTIKASDARVELKQGRTRIVSHTAKAHVQPLQSTMWMLRMAGLQVSFRLSREGDECDRQEHDEVLSDSDRDNACSQIDIGLKTAEEQQACLSEAIKNKLSQDLAEPEVEELTDATMEQQDVGVQELLVEINNNAAAKTCLIQQSLQKRLSASQAHPCVAMAPTVGKFVEIGNGKNSDSIAEITEIDFVDGRTVVHAKLRGISDDLSVFKHHGKLERKGPDKRGNYHWIMYHPAAKVLFGLVCGKRWFCDRVHGGEQQALAEATETLAMWRDASHAELHRREQRKICLCADFNCGRKKRQRGKSEPVLHAQAWRCMNVTSVEHMLHGVGEKGSKLAEK